MKFNHEVKHNGVYYPAGTEVPIETENGGVKSPAVEVSGKDTNETFEQVKGKKRYTEQDLAGKKFFALKGMARAEGFDVPNDAKSEDIKKMLLSIEV